MSKYDALMITAEVQERSVKLPDGSEQILHFRELPAIVWRKFRQREESQDEDVRAGAVAFVIASSLCEPDGTLALSYDQACNLTAQAMNSLFVAILSLSGKDGERKNGSASAGSLGSGTPSPSRSEAEQ